MKSNPKLPTRAKIVSEGKLFERKWDVKFKIGDVWSQLDEIDPEDEEGFDQFKLLIMPKIRNFQEKMEMYLEEDEDEIFRLDDIIMDLDNAEDSAEWDYAWDDFYDWADDNKVWVEIHEEPDENGENVEEL